MAKYFANTGLTRRSALLLAAALATPRAAHAGDSAVTKLAPADLQAMLAHKDFLLINVHIPYEGEIEPTDAFIPYDTIAQSLDKLPQDRSTRIVVYCKGGPMSAIAATELVGLGFTQVGDLMGGMDGWEGSGQKVIGK